MVCARLLAFSLTSVLVDNNLHRDRGLESTETPALQVLVSQNGDLLHTMKVRLAFQAAWPDRKPSPLLVVLGQEGEMFGELPVLRVEVVSGCTLICTLFHRSATSNGSLAAAPPLL
jgi:hypothetical protein